MSNLSADHIRQLVRDRYGKIPASGSGCGSPCCQNSEPTTEGGNCFAGYSTDQLTSVVEGADMGLGCGNPTVMGNLKPGEIVLDLGSGGGIDCFLAAKAVGPTGKVIGVDMTPEMLTKARENADKMAVTNVEFRLGEIEHLPVADNRVDVILSNCVINLSPEKRQVFTESFRVLHVGGRLAISDVVALKPLPPEIKEQAALLTGCVAGAETIENIETMLKEIGFQEIKITIRQKSRDWLRDMFPGSGVEEYVASADVEAVK